MWCSYCSGTSQSLVEPSSWTQNVSSSKAVGLRRRRPSRTSFFSPVYGREWGQSFIVDTSQMLLIAILGYPWGRALSLRRTERKISNPHPMVAGDPDRDQRTPQTTLNHQESERCQRRIHPHRMRPPLKSPDSSSSLSRKSLRHN